MAQRRSASPGGKDGRFRTRPLDLPEDDLLKLLRKAIDGGVFSETFIGKHRSQRMLRDASRSVLAEHSMVNLASGLTLDDGRDLLAGALGAVVFVHGEGEAYEVEFIAPFHAVATVAALQLSPAPAPA